MNTSEHAGMCKTNVSITSPEYQDRKLCFVLFLFNDLYIIWQMQIENRTKMTHMNLISESKKQFNQCSLICEQMTPMSWFFLQNHKHTV